MSAPYQLVIHHEGADEQRFKLPCGIYTLGQDKQNKIVLQDPSISWKHAVLSVSEQELAVEDLNSNTGTYIEGERIRDRKVFRPGQQLQVGTYSLRVLAFSQEKKPVPPPPPAQKTEPVKPATPKPVATPPPSLPPKKSLSPEARIRRNIKQQVHQELLDRLDLRRMTAENIEESGLQARARELVDQIINDVRERLPQGIDPQKLADEIYNEAVKLGPLEEYLEDDSITEIMVNGFDQIYLERGGKLVRGATTFVDDNSVQAIIERIVAPLGRRIDESRPYVDARLPDGSRVNAIIHPLSLIGPCVTIRKFSKKPFTVDKLIELGAITRGMALFSEICVKLRKNIIISGGTGSGKTTFLNVISSYLPDNERILTVEDAAELQLPQEHVVRLEARPANIEGTGAITIRDLVRNALRMRPDRIVVGECRGGEALDMLQAMNTGHEGSLTTVHANSPRDAMSRLETMVLMAGMDLPIRAIREQIGSAIHIVIQLARFQDGSRRVSKMTEVCGMEGDRIVLQDLFEFKQTGIDENGKVLGNLVPSGNVPTFIQDIHARGLDLDPAVFDPQYAENFIR
ncbi:ATPase, T2SS/T4P/T4SS family [Kiritimatiellaeota bacterium B1221]|nr:ATPase, T2SS/T4P/T4SS family [Kiritimatiellaeota bacterium B1221]